MCKKNWCQGLTQNVYVLSLLLSLKIVTLHLASKFIKVLRVLFSLSGNQDMKAYHKITLMLRNWHSKLPCHFRTWSKGCL